MRRIRTRALSWCGALALVVASTIGGAGGCSTFAGDSGAPAGTDGGDDAPSGDSAADTAPGTGIDGATTDDAAADAKSDAASHVARFDVACGAAACTIAGDGCCWDFGMKGTAGYGCARAADACPVSGDRRFTCDDDDDCAVLGFPGNVCCGTLVLSSNNYSLLSTACTRPENCAGPSDLQLCDRTLGGQCPNGKPCIDRATFPQPNGAVGTWPINPSVPACGP